MLCIFLGFRKPRRQIQTTKRKRSNTLIFAKKLPKRLIFYRAYNKNEEHKYSRSEFYYPGDLMYPGLRGFSWYFTTWESCERAAKSRSGEKEKPLVTLDLILTFMQTPAVKHVNLIIQRGTNGSLAITCLSSANVSTRVVRSGIFWPTWPSQCACLRECFHTQQSRKLTAC